MIDLRCDRLNYSRGGSALGSIGLVWGGTALLDALSYLSYISFKSAILAPQQAKDKQMKNLTTPQAILCGFALIALAIASIPYSSNIVSPASANSGTQKIAICNASGERCADMFRDKFYKDWSLRVVHSKR